MLGVLSSKNNEKKSNKDLLPLILLVHLVTARSNVASDLLPVVDAK